MPKNSFSIWNSKHVSALLIALFTGITAVKAHADEDRYFNNMLIFSR